MAQNYNLLVLCGGQSAEHEVSICSAMNVIKALDKKKYDILIGYITREGKWFLMTNHEMFFRFGPQHCLSQKAAEAVTLVLGDKQCPLVSLQDLTKRYAVDCVFPLGHGTLCEDGALQGLLQLMQLPYVGADVLSSAICMSKPMTKSLLRFAGLPTCDWLAIYADEKKSLDYQKIANRFGSSILFIKPANLGSSVGISKVHNSSEFFLALDTSFQFDNQIIIEPAIIGREIECSVLGNEHPVASCPGEIIVQHEFYSYEAKYVDPEGARVVSPAELPVLVVEKIKDLAIKAFRTLQISGMARVDFFVNEQEILISELNTIPGFTDISMYPKNWHASGLSYSDLLDNLIQLARQRHEQIAQRELRHKSGHAVQPQVMDN